MNQNEKDLLKKSIKLIKISFLIDKLETELSTFNPIRYISDTESCVKYERLLKLCTEITKMHDKKASKTSESFGVEVYEKLGTEIDSAFDNLLKLF